VSAPASPVPASISTSTRCVSTKADRTAFSREIRRSAVAAASAPRGTGFHDLATTTHRCSSATESRSGPCSGGSATPPPRRSLTPTRTCGRLRRPHARRRRLRTRPATTHDQRLDRTSGEPTTVPRCDAQERTSRSSNVDRSFVIDDFVCWRAFGAIFNRVSAAHRRRADELACKPDPVTSASTGRRPSIWVHRRRWPRAVHPQARASSPQAPAQQHRHRCSLRPCSGWGLPSRSGHPERWCALTAPFHPYQYEHRQEKVEGKLAAPEYAVHTEFGRQFPGNGFEKRNDVVYCLESDPGRWSEN
jgi:hypothetical protein